MSTDAKLDALRWQALQSPSPTARVWAELAKATALSDSFANAVTKAMAVTKVYERSVRALPYSYKMWMLYIDFRTKDTRSLCTANEWFQSVRDVYERAVAKLPQMPLLWVSYLEFVSSFPLLRVTMLRHLLSRSLSALPVTQHHLLWKVVKPWSANPAVPRGTFRELWALYLQFDTSTAAQRQYFSLLQKRGDTAEYVRECARVVSAVAGKADSSPADRRLFEDTAFWEPLLLAFQSPGWFLDQGAADDNHTTAATSVSVTGTKNSTTLGTLDSLVAFGRRFCASSFSLELAYIGFLYGQGQISKGRAALERMLDEAPDPQTFSEVFRIAVELEDQVVESFSLSNDARELYEQDREGYLAAARQIFGSTDPCAHVARLVRDYPLLVNQAQLRCHPRCVPLWLKRTELLQERVYSSLATSKDVAALYLQAIAQCTGGLEAVDTAAAQLYQSYAHLLCSCGRSREACDVLREASWNVRFSSSAANALLLGLLTEIQLLSGTPATSVATAITKILSSTTSSSAAGAGPGARRRRGALLASLGGGDSVEVVPTSLLLRDPRPWLLAGDLTKSSASALAVIAQQYSSSTAYTAEGAVHFAYAFWRGLCDTASATQEFEKAITRFRPDPVATLFIAEQYIAFLCLQSAAADPSAPSFPLHRCRELFRIVEDVLPAAVQHTPAAALDLAVSCAFIERWRGLYGNAVRLLKRAAEVALEHLAPSEHFVLLASIVEKTIRCTQQFKGCLGTRQLCSSLLRRTSYAPLLQRIALHWAAVERRCGNAAQAHGVLDACGDSQNPATPWGTTYWKLWESLCTNIDDFEKLVRRRQQVEVRFQKQQSTTTITTGTK